jgi:hypothetical protein
MRVRFSSGAWKTGTEVSLKAVRNCEDQSRYQAGSCLKMAAESSAWREVA